jgi:enoyl-CoA hydratase
MSGTQSTTSDDELLVERPGPLVVVTLNRPRALNALTFAMCRALAAGMRRWAADDAVGAVWIEGAGDRAFCAGGDIRNVTETVEKDGVDAALPFFRTEYRLNAMLHHFAKPWVAILDGVVMGGGVGISIHGRHRIATERTRFAMPETGIGFFPDVGGTWFLPRLPGEIGMFLGLSGRPLTGADCLELGIATAFVPSERLPDLKRRLVELTAGPDFAERLQGVFELFHEWPGTGELAPFSGRIDACFSGRTLDGVFLKLETESSGFGAELLAVLGKKSPTSLAVAFEQLRRGRDLATFDEAMRLEYRLVARFLAGHDFREGVRALIVDKDGHPAWQPRYLRDVDPEEVARYFAPLPGGDLDLTDVGEGT